MADISTYLGNKLLDAIFRNVSFQCSPYASLHSADAGLTGANELTGNAYARVPATFGAPSSGATDNTGLITFPVATPAGWTAATYGGLWDQQAAGGNFLVNRILANARTVNLNEYAEFAVGTWDFSWATAFGATVIDGIVNAFLRNTALAYTPYMSLHSGDPGTTGANELTGNGYGRVAPTFGTGAAAKAVANTAPCDLGPATGSNWAAATYLGCWSATTNGVFLWGRSMTSRTVEVGKVFRAAIGDVAPAII